MEITSAAFVRWLDETAARVGILSHAELARRLNVSETTISRWLSGQREPGHKELADLASVLGVTRLELYRRLGLVEQVRSKGTEGIMAVVDQLPEAGQSVVRAAAEESLRQHLARRGSK